MYKNKNYQQAITYPYNQRGITIDNPTPYNESSDKHHSNTVNLPRLRKVQQKQQILTHTEPTFNQIKIDTQSKILTPIEYIQMQQHTTTNQNQELNKTHPRKESNSIKPYSKPNTKSITSKHPT